MALSESDTWHLRRIMSHEIGEILGRLKENNVFDFEDQLPIILINRSVNPINIKESESELLEVKRIDPTSGFSDNNNMYVIYTVDAFKPDPNKKDIVMGKSVLVRSNDDARSPFTYLYDLSVINQGQGMPLAPGNFINVSTVIVNNADLSHWAHADHAPDNAVIGEKVCYYGVLAYIAKAIHV